MNSLWDDWFIDPFLSAEELAKKYGGLCEWCGRGLLKFPYCRCHLIFDAEFKAARYGK